MMPIPASAVLVGLAALLSLPSALHAADWFAPIAITPPRASVSSEASVVQVNGSGPSASSRDGRERLNWGYGGAQIDHHFGYHPHDLERPRYRRYYPYVWGGYSFSAPYYVPRTDYDRPEYAQVPYGKAQKYRWKRDHNRPDVWEDGRW